MADKLFDIYDDKGTKVVDGKPSPVTISGLSGNTTYKGYKAANAGDTTAMATLDDMTTTPGKPSLVVTAGDGKADFSITPATGDGNAQRSYVVSYSTDGTKFTDIPEATTTGTIDGLTNGTAYTFKVVAKNSAGTSTASEATAGTPTAPASSPKA
ncbi:fibronectin type III domain-containing protein [Lactiplantibacillus paraxiangfangensis]|uniref:fibronectin type III domain-containing protein n=1 Tax=Lactiplantibacillus paraxiangfangensis TaxID=3076224 RepID=UPI0030C68E04